MKKILLIALILIGCVLHAQNIKIYGKVVNSDSESVPGASVMLIGQQDSILKSFAITDKEGNFVIQNVKKHDYLFKANFYGYEPYTVTFSVNENSRDTALAEIQLMPKMLNTVTVNADYIPIQIKGDTIEYDSRAFEVAEHDVVENLLAQLPGVEVQTDGTIKVQGKTVEKILVDGQEFFGNDPIIASKNLPADAIDKVQVFDKESDMSAFTGVSDGDESTTINLKLKEDRKTGVFGNLEAAYGGGEDLWSDFKADWNRYKLKGNIHYFKNKWQVSLIGLANNVNETGFSINDYINFIGGIQNLVNGSGRLNLDGDSGFPIDMGQNNGFLSTNALGFNLSYRPSDKASFSSNIFFNTFDKSFDRTVDRTTFFEDSSIFSNEHVLQRSFTYNNRGNIHYKQEFDSTHFLNVDLSGQWSLANYNNDNILSNFDNGGLIRNEYITDLQQDNFQYTATLAVDYRKKFRKKGRYMGGGASFGIDNRDISTDLMYQNKLYLTTPIFSETFQNQADNRRNTNASANWMFSEALNKKNLLQFEAKYLHNTESRDKAVEDEVSPNVFTPNSFLSGVADYSYQTLVGEMRYKYLSKKLKTTIGASYNHLTLMSPDLFTANHSYHYTMPFARLQWDINKKSELEFNYFTRTNSPSLLQLQTLPDNTNPAEIVLGNIDLNPEYIHELSVGYNYFNEYSFMHLMTRVGASRVQNKINYSQSIDANFNRVFTPMNIGIEDRLNSYVSFGSNISPIKTKFSITNSSNLSKGIVELNGVQSDYTSFYTNSKLTIENTKKKVINARAGIEGTYSLNTYADNEALNSDFFSWNYFADFTWKIKDNWIINANTTHNFYPSFTSNNELFILNASVARNLLKSKKLQVYISALDILNQNTGINQSYFLNYYEEEQTATLARYFMLGVKYSFQKLGGK